MTELIDAHVMSRRRFLLASAQVAIGLSLTAPFDLFAGQVPSQPLTFYHTHTGERFDLHHTNGICTATVKKQFNTFLRDFRTGDIHAIDFQLVNILHKIQTETGCDGVFEVISGYRSPKTNKALQTRSSGVAKKSLHMRGRAIDVRLTGLPTSELRDVAISLKGGGVGYYAKSDFVHLDTGHVRCW